MTANYKRIIDENLRRIHAREPEMLTAALPAERIDDAFCFEAFGENCRITTQGVLLKERLQSGVLGVLISLYACQVQPTPPVVYPLKAFKELPDSMPYAGAFTTHTEAPLVPHVPRIESGQDLITETLKGKIAPKPAAGDFSFTLWPLPKIALGYIFYRADEDFPAAVTCLFSNNALDFMPLDGLADVGEYTSRKILSLLDTHQA